MKLTYLYDGQYPSFAADAWQVINTCAALSRQGVQVTLVYPSSTSSSPLTGEELLNYYQLPGKLEVVTTRQRISSRTVQKALHPVQGILKQTIRNSDLLYSRNVPPLLVAAATGKPIVYDTYRPWPSQYRAMKVLFKQLFRRKNMLGAFFHSTHTWNSFANAGIPTEKLQVAHNGFNEHFFATPLSVSQARKQIGLSHTEFTVGYTGRLSREKGTEALVQLAEGAPDLHLLLVGSGAEPDLKERMQKAPNITLFDSQPPHTIPNYLWACDCLIIPPSATALAAGNTVLPMKLFPYLASGRPIVAPCSPDTADVLTHNENSWLIEPDNLKDAAERIRELRDNPDLRNTLGEKALDDAQHLSWDARGRKLVGHINHWLNSK